MVRSSNELNAQYPLRLAALFNRSIEIEMKMASSR